MKKFKFYLLIFFVGSIHLAHRGYAQDIKWLEELADNDNFFAVTTLWLYHHNSKNTEKSVEFCNKRDALEYRAKYNQNSNTPAKEDANVVAQIDLSTLEKKAKSGDVEAMNDLTNYYYSQKDYKKAVKWAEKSAKKGNVEGMNDSGLLWCYFLNNKEKGRKWYEIAIATGNNDAKYNYAYSFYDGNMKFKNFTSDAHRYLKEAAEAGNADAQLLYLKKMISDKAPKDEIRDFVISISNSPNQNFENVLQVLKSENMYVNDDIDDLIEQVALNGNRNAQKIYIDKYISPRNRSFNDKKKKLGEILLNYGYRDYINTKKEYNSNNNADEDYHCIKIWNGIFLSLASVDSEEADKQAYECIEIIDHINKDISSPEAFFIGKFYNNNKYKKDLEKARYYFSRINKEDLSTSEKKELEDMGISRVGYNLLVITENGQSGLYNTKTHEYVVPLGKYTNYSNDIIRGLILVWDKDDNLGAIEADGKVIIPAKYAKIINIQNGKFLKVVTKDNQQGAYDFEGKIIIAPGRYNRIGYDSGGYITVYNAAGQVGLVDAETGAQIIAPTYRDFVGFSLVNGNLLFTDSKKAYVLTSSGKLVWSGPLNGTNHALSICRRYMGTEYITYSQEFKDQL